MYIFSITHEHSNQRGSVSKKATFKCEFIAPIVFVFPPRALPQPQLDPNWIPAPIIDDPIGIHSGLVSKITCSADGQAGRRN